MRLLSVPGGQALVGALGLEEPGGHTNLSRFRQIDQNYRTILKLLKTGSEKDLKRLLTLACSPHQGL